MTGAAGLKGAPIVTGAACGAVGGGIVRADFARRFPSSHFPFTRWICPASFSIASASDVSQARVSPRP